MTIEQKPSLFSKVQRKETEDPEARQATEKNIAQALKDGIKEINAQYKSFGRSAAGIVRIALGEGTLTIAIVPHAMSSEINSSSGVDALYTKLIKNAPRFGVMKREDLVRLVLDSKGPASLIAKIPTTSIQSKIYSTEPHLLLLEWSFHPQTTEKDQPAVKRVAITAPKPSKEVEDFLDDPKRAWWNDDRF